MLRVGVTGGIGSGKSVVCKIFGTLGIPVFKADDAANYLMNHDPGLMTGIKSLLGEGVYKNGLLDTPAVSAIIYNDPEKLQQLNSLVHPTTISYADRWIGEQTSPYIIKEAAIFFESGSYKAIDVMIGVSCPLDLRIERAMQRSGLARQKVLDIIAQQMDEEEKMKRCDHVIINDDKTPVLSQVLALHRVLLAQSMIVNI